MRRTLIPFLLSLVLLFPVYAPQAQDVPVQPLQRNDSSSATVAPIQQSLPPEEADSKMDIRDPEVTIMRDEYAGQYHLSTLENLSRLYWRLGVFDLNDTEAVANFLKINECKIYTDYLKDDLEWKNIMVVMQDYIKKNKDMFSLNFQFVLPLELGTFDAGVGGFPIVNKTSFKGVNRIQLDSLNYNRDICFDNRPIKDYPKSVMLLLDKPFTLDLIKLDEHVAQAFILRKKAEYDKLPEEMRVRNYQRSAYLRLRVSFSQYNGNLGGFAGQDLMAVLYGKIDGYEIFEDRELRRLMTSVSLLAPVQPPPQAKDGALLQQSAPVLAPVAPSPIVPAQQQPSQPSAAPVSASPVIILAPEQGAIQGQTVTMPSP